MQKCILVFGMLALALSLFACGNTERDGNISGTAPASPSTALTQPSATEDIPATAATDPAPLHSPLYIEGLDVEDVIRYFNEVCLDAEIVNSGNPSLVQKWAAPITYTIEGSFSDEDMAVLNKFMDWLNSVEGFPGIYAAAEPELADLAIHFCTQPEQLQILGNSFADMDGGVTFWYNGANQIYSATICYRTDILQTVRNSVILEEIYNGLGPVQDTQLRTDSIIYSGYSEPQHLSAIDELILRLLYHPQITCGMDAAACEAVIRSLYY